MIKNTLALTVLQATNYLLPLVTLPYLTRILGADGYGKIVFAQLFIHYFIIVTDFGFNQVGVRQISENRNSHEKLNLILSSIFTVRLILVCGGLISLILIVLLFESLRSDLWLYLFTYGSVIGQAFFPVWFFQGIEKMKFITLINLLSKVVFTALIFLAVKDIKDYLLVPIISTIGYAISAVAGSLIITVSFQQKIKIANWGSIKSQLKAGLHLMATNLSISSFGHTNGFVLGNVAGSTIMGYYGGVEKIIQVFRFMLNPLYMALYPYFVQKNASDKNEFMRETRLGILFSFLIGALIYLIVRYFSSEIINIVLGVEFKDSIYMLNLYAIMILITPVSYLLFNNIYLALKLEHISMRIYILGGIINLFMLGILVSLKIDPAKSAILSNIIAQVIILLIALRYLIVNNRLSIKKEI